MAFPEAFLRRRRREPMDERLPDGRSVQELIMEQRMRGAERFGGPSGNYQDNALSQTPSPQVLTLQNQQAITRPRTVTPTQEPTQQQSPFIDAFTRPRRTQPRDFVADDAAYARDVNKQGRTWRDKVVDVTDALNAVAGGPKRVIPTKRERELMRAQGQLEQDFEVQKQEMNQMVPVTLEDGTQVMAPRRSAGTLQSQQQRIRSQNETNAERKRVNTARMTRWDNMDKRDRNRLVVDLYKSGALNDPEMLEYAADQLGIPGTLREKFIAGQMRDAIDAEGNLVQINRQTQEVLPTGQKSFEVTKEAGRERRFEENQDRLKNPPIKPPSPSKPDAAAGRRAARLIGIIEDSRREMSEADKVGDKVRREKAQRDGQQAATELNALNAGYEAGPGEGGYPYYKQREAAAAPTQQSGVTEAQIREAAKAKGLDPEIAVKRARARKLIP